MSSQVGPILEEPLHAFAEARQAIDVGLFQHLDRKQRDDPDDGANA